MCERLAHLRRLTDELLVPRLCVTERILFPHRQDPAVAARERPRPPKRPFIGAVLVGTDPADEQCREPALCKMVGSCADDALRDFVAAKSAVAVGPAAFRRDDVRRVARNQVETLTGRRLEETAATDLDVREAVPRSAGSKRAG